MSNVHRFLAKAAVTACAATITLSASAVTPKDYAMPYTKQANGGKFAGIQLVASANFANTAQLLPVGTAVSFPNTIIGGAASGGTIVDLRPHSIIWGEGANWKAAPLRSGLSPAPVQVSSENQVAVACDTQPVYTNFTAPQSTALFYRLPGVNNTCKNADDVIRRVGVSDGPGVAPTTVAGYHSLSLNPVYLANGALKAVYSVQSGNLVRLAADLTTQATVLANVNRFEVVGQLADATALAIINSNVKRIKPDGTLVTKPVRKPKAGYKIDEAVLHGTNVYVLETAKDSGNPIQTRIYRVPAKGASGQSVEMLNLPGRATLQGFTTDSLLYSTSGQSSALFAYPQTGTLNSTTPVTIHTMAPGDTLTVFTTSGANVFFHVFGFVFVPPSTFNVSFHAWVKDDTAAIIQDYAEGSAYGGGQISASTGDALEHEETFSRLLLVTGGTSSAASPALRGGVMNSLNPQTLTSNIVTTLPNTVLQTFGIAIGPGGIGSMISDNGSGGSSQGDVFAFDLTGNRYTRITNGTAGTEVPLP